MKATSAFLADSAQVRGGKLYVLGGAFDTIRSKRFPVIHKAMSFVMVLEITPSERDQVVDIAVDLLDEDMNPTGSKAKGQFNVPEPRAGRPGQASVFPIAIPFFDVRFPHAGGYVFRVTFGEGEELVRVPFWVQEVE
jgi:hypothetical protein